MERKEGRRKGRKKERKYNKINENKVIKIKKYFYY